MQYESVAYPSMQGIGPPESGRLQKICALVESSNITRIMNSGRKVSSHIDSDTQLDFEGKYSSSTDSLASKRTTALHICGFSVKFLRFTHPLSLYLPTLSSTSFYSLYCFFALTQ